MKVSKKKLAAALGAGAIAAAGSGIAFAYWSAGGSGFGTGSVDNPNLTNVLTIDTVGVPSNLVPNGSGAISGTVHNGQSYSVAVHGLTATVTTSDETNCPGATNFSVSNLALAGTAASSLSSSPVTLAKDTGTAAITGTLTMNDLASNQDACKGTTVTVTYNAS